MWQETHPETDDIKDIQKKNQMIDYSKNITRNFFTGASGHSPGGTARDGMAPLHLIFYDVNMAAHHFHPPLT
jgi:hypothetical protein